ADVPVEDMLGLGGLKSLAAPVALAADVLRFFGVPSVASWRSVYHDALRPVAFRTSSTFESQPGAIAAWLRQGEHEAASIRCERWDPDKFKEQLQVIRGLTRERDPQVFLPELRRLFAECGVAVVALRAPKKCRARGASRFPSP